MKAHLCKKAEVKLALCAANDEQYPLPLLLYEQPPSKKKKIPDVKKRRKNTRSEKQNKNKKKIPDVKKNKKNTENLYIIDALA